MKRWKFGPIVLGAMIALAIGYRLTFGAIEPSVGLYWTSSTDPTVAPGQCAPLWQLLFRTDNHTFYVKTASACTGWTQFGGSGGATGTVTSVSTTAEMTVANPTTTPQISFSAGTASGQAKQYNGAGWVNSPVIGDPSLAFYQIEEFTQTTTNCATIGANFIGTVSGTGATCAVATATVGHPGILALQTGSTSTGLARFRNNGINTAVGGSNGVACQRALVQWPVLSTATDEYISRWGFLDSLTSADSVNAVEAIYDRLNNGNFFALQSCNSSVCNKVICNGTGGTTSEPIVAATWYTTEVCVNSAGTSTSLSVNGTVCATSAVDIPNSVSWGAQMVKTAGTTSLNMFLDYMSTLLPFSVAR